MHPPIVRSSKFRNFTRDKYVKNLLFFWKGFALHIDHQRLTQFLNFKLLLQKQFKKFFVAKRNLKFKSSIEGELHQ